MPTTPYRTLPQLHRAIRTADTPYARAALGVEYLVSRKAEQNPIYQHHGWEKIHWLLQFWPLKKYITKLGIIGHLNISVPYAGLIGSPKDQLSQNIDPKYLPKTLVYNELPTVDTVVNDLKQNHITYPFIAKPTIGERAWGVERILDADHLAQYVQHAQYAFMIQEFVEGPEYTVMFLKQPDGTYSVPCATYRHLPFVTGDGKHTTQQLIMAHTDLLPTQKDKIIESLQSTDILHTKPKKGTQQRIVFTASIMYGTQYINAPDIATAIVPYINQALQNTTLDAGRFDVIATSEQALMKGDFRIIETNGICGMPTNIYTDIPIAQKYQILEDYFDTLLDRAKQNKAKHHGATLHLIPLLGTCLRMLMRRAGHSRRVPLTQRIQNLGKTLSKHYHNVCDVLTIQQFLWFKR